MTVLLFLLAAAAVLWVHLFHQGRRAKQIIRDDATLTAMARARDEARRARDAALDAVADMLDAIGRWRAEDAAVIGRAVLDTNRYPGRVQALQDALDDAEDEVAQLRACLAEAGLTGDADEDADEVPVFHGHQRFREGEDC